MFFTSESLEKLLFSLTTRCRGKDESYTSLCRVGKREERVTGEQWWGLSGWGFEVNNRSESGNLLPERRLFNWLEWFSMQSCCLLLCWMNACIEEEGSVVMAWCAQSTVDPLLALNIMLWCQWVKCGWCSWTNVIKGLIMHFFSPLLYFWSVSLSSKPQYSED